MLEFGRDGTALAMVGCLLGAVVLISFGPFLLDFLGGSAASAQVEELRSAVEGAAKPVQAKLRTLEARQAVEREEVRQQERRLADLSSQIQHYQGQKEGLARALVQETRRLAQARTDRERWEEEARKWNDPNVVFVDGLYPGTGGTKKIPLYVECREGDMVILPSGTVLTPEQLTTADSGFTREARRLGYVLFLVRPNGLKTFLTAWAAAEQLGVGLGWEPVEPHWTIEVEREAS